MENKICRHCFNLVNPQIVNIYDWNRRNGWNWKFWLVWLNKKKLSIIENHIQIGFSGTKNWWHVKTFLYKLYQRFNIFISEFYQHKCYPFMKNELILYFKWHNSSYDEHGLDPPDVRGGGAGQKMSLLLSGGWEILKF